jgi:hypothetical protein
MQLYCHTMFHQALSVTVYQMRVDSAPGTTAVDYQAGPRWY